MEFVRKNKLIVGLIIVIVLALGGLLFMRQGGQKTALPVASEQEIKKLTPSDIGLELKLKSDKKAVIMTVSKLDGIKSIEYEVSYDAEVVEEGETINVPRGVVSSDPIEPDAGTIEKEILLGTCSANVCKYDKVTSEIKFLVRVNFENGEVGSVEDSIAVEE